MKFALMIAAMGFIPGCFIARNGARQRITFESVPAGARVQFHGQEGTTPCTLSVSRSYKPQEIVFTRDAQELREEIVSTDAMRDPLDFFFVVGDSLLIIPVLVDFAGQAFWRFPDRISADFGKRTIRLERDVVEEAPPEPAKPWPRADYQ